MTLLLVCSTDMAEKNGETSKLAEATQIVTFVSNQGKQVTKIVNNAACFGQSEGKSQVNDIKENGRSFSSESEEQKQTNKINNVTLESEFDQNRKKEIGFYTVIKEEVKSDEEMLSQEASKTVHFVSNQGKQVTNVVKDAGCLRQSKGKSQSTDNQQNGESFLPQREKQTNKIKNAAQEKIIDQNKKEDMMNKGLYSVIKEEVGSDEEIISQENERKLYIVCNTCLKKDGKECTFPTGLSLAEHVNKLHHKSPQITGPQVRFTCHTKKISYHCFPVVQEKVYACKFGNCPKKFTCEDLLNKHLPRCQFRGWRVREYTKCQYRFCDRLFPSQESRKQHVKDVHVDHNIDIQDNYGALWVIKTSFNEQNSVNCISQSEEQQIQEEVLKEIKSLFLQTFQIKRLVFSTMNDFVTSCEKYGDFIETDVLSGTSLEKFGSLKMNETISTVRRIYEEINHSDGDFIVNINNIKCRILHSGIIVRDSETDCFVYIDDGERKDTDVWESGKNHEINKPLTKNIQGKVELFDTYKSSLKTIKPKDVEVDIGDLVFLYGKPDLNYSSRDTENQSDIPDEEGEIIYNDPENDKNYAVLSCDTFPNDSDTISMQDEQFSSAPVAVKIESLEVPHVKNLSTVPANDKPYIPVKREVDSFHEETIDLKSEIGHDGTLSDNVINDHTSQCDNTVTVNKTSNENKAKEVHTWNEEHIGSCISIPESHLVVEDLLSEIPEDLLHDDSELLSVRSAESGCDKFCDKLEIGDASLNKESSSVNAFINLHKSASTHDAKTPDLSADLSYDLSAGLETKNIPVSTTIGNNVNFQESTKRINKEISSNDEMDIESENSNDETENENTVEKLTIDENSNNGYKHLQNGNRQKAETCYKIAHRQKEETGLKSSFFDDVKFARVNSEEKNNFGNGHQDLKLNTMMDKETKSLTSGCNDRMRLKTMMDKENKSLTSGCNDRIRLQEYESDKDQNSRSSDDIFINISEKVKNSSRKKHFSACDINKERKAKWLVDGLEIKECKINLFKLEPDDIKYLCEEIKAGHCTEYANYLYSMQKIDAHNFDQLINGSTKSHMKPNKYKRLLQICKNMFQLNKFLQDNPRKDRKRSSKLSRNRTPKKLKTGEGDTDFDWLVYNSDDSWLSAEYSDDLESYEDVDEDFICPEPGCEKRFDTSASMEHHINKKHGEDYQYTERKVCPVDECDKSYAFKNNLMTHIKRDHGEDVYLEITSKLYGVKQQKSKPMEFRPAGTCLMPTIWRKPQPLIPPHVKEKIEKTSQSEPLKNVKEVEDIKNILSDFTQNGKGSFFSLLSNT